VSKCISYLCVHAIYVKYSTHRVRVNTCLTRDKLSGGSNATEKEREEEEEDDEDELDDEEEDVDD
jgi:hypothetical protein